MIDQFLTALSNIGKMLVYDPGAPMIFSSGLFWLVFLIFLPVFAALRGNRLRMVVFVSAFSLYFYYKSSGVFFLLLLATSIIDWTVSRLIARTDVKWKRKTLFCLSVSLSTPSSPYHTWSMYTEAGWLLPTVGLTISFSSLSFLRLWPALLFVRTTSFRR